MPELSAEELQRYGRQLQMPEVTQAGQLRLKQARVLCVGAGGLGSPATLYLAAAGVGTLGLVEFDDVDLSNIQRQILYATDDVGTPKIDSAMRRLAALNPNVRLQPHPLRLDADNVLDLVAGYDLVVDGSDNFATRYLVNDACVLLGKPDVSASVYRFEGQLSVFDARRGPCYRCLFPEPPPTELAPSCAEAGVLGVLPGILGTLQALEAIKLILRQGEPLIGRLLLLDALPGEFREFAVRKNPECRLCGPAATIRKPQAPAAVCGDEPASGRAWATISVEQFAAQRASGNAGSLIDVRDAHELDIVRIPGSQHLPLGELTGRIDELDRDGTYVITCHHGVRSRQAADLLAAQGFARLQVLEGGVDAWARLVDPALPRY